MSALALTLLGIVGAVVFGFLALIVLAAGFLFAVVFLPCEVGR